MPDYHPLHGNTHPTELRWEYVEKGLRSGRYQSAHRNAWGPAEIYVKFDGINLYLANYHTGKPKPFTPSEADKRARDWSALWGNNVQPLRWDSINRRFIED